MEESFRLLVESDEIRIGVRSAGSENGIEVLVRLVLPGHTFDPGQARDMIRRLEVMIDLGYNPTVHEGWWVVCERSFPHEELSKEANRVLDLFLDLLPGPTEGRTTSWYEDQ